MQYDEGTHEKLYELIKLRGWNFGPEEMNNLVGKEWDEYFGRSKRNGTRIRSGPRIPPLAKSTLEHTSN